MFFQKEKYKFYFFFTAGALQEFAPEKEEISNVHGNDNIICTYKQ